MVLPDKMNPPSDGKEAGSRTYEEFTSAGSDSSPSNIAPVLQIFALLSIVFIFFASFDSDQDTLLQDPPRLLSSASQQKSSATTAKLELSVLYSLLLFVAFQVFVLLSSEEMAPPNDQSRPTSRGLPIDRRAAYQYHPPRSTPPVPTNREQRQQRLTALRNQLRYPHALAEATLVKFLNANDWDVNRAAQAFWESDEVAQDYVRPPTVELGRLRQLHDMLTGLGNNTNQELQTSSAVMAVLFNENEWNIDRAIADINDRNGYYGDTIEQLASLRVRPDGDVTRDERLARLIDITSTNSWYSALQFLIDHEWDLAMALDTWFRSGGLPVVYPPKPREKATVRDDGLRDVNANRPPRVVRGEIFTFDLEQHAFDEQQTSDSITFTRPAGEVNADPEIPWARTEPLPAELRTPAATARGIDPEPVPGRDYITGIRGATGFPRGALINQDRSSAIVHCPDMTKLYTEFIRDQTYNVYWFEGKFRVTDSATGRRQDLPFNWDDGNVAVDGRAEFDWHNKAHIHRLNRWRNNALLQITGQATREKAGDKINKYEEDWLCQEEAARLEEKFYELAGPNINYPGAIQTAQRFFSDPGNFPMSLSQAELEALTKRFNDTFAGRRFYQKTIHRNNPSTPTGNPVLVTRRQKDMQRVGVIPRPSRSAALIRVHRHRILNLAKHFMLSYEYKDRHKVKDEVFLVDESDSDFDRNAEESDGESDDGSDHGDSDEDMDGDDGGNGGNDGNGSAGGSAGGIADVSPETQDAIRAGILATQQM